MRKNVQLKNIVILLAFACTAMAAAEYYGLWLPEEYIPDGWRHDSEGRPVGKIIKNKENQNLVLEIPLLRNGGKIAGRNDNWFEACIHYMCLHKSVKGAKEWCKKRYEEHDCFKLPLKLNIGDGAYVHSGSLNEDGGVIIAYKRKYPHHVPKHMEPYVDENGEIMYRKMINFRKIRVGRITFGLRIHNKFINDYEWITTVKNGRESTTSRWFVAASLVSDEEMFQVARLFTHKVRKYAVDQGWMKESEIPPDDHLNLFENPFKKGTSRDQEYKGPSPFNKGPDTAESPDAEEPVEDVPEEDAGPVTPLQAAAGAAAAGIIAALGAAANAAANGVSVKNVIPTVKKAVDFVLGNEPELDSSVPADQQAVPVAVQPVSEPVRQTVDDRKERILEREKNRKAREKKKIEMHKKRDLLLKKVKERENKFEWIKAKADAVGFDRWSQDERKFLKTLSPEEKALLRGDPVTIEARKLGASDYAVYGLTGVELACDVTVSAMGDVTGPVGTKLKYGYIFFKSVASQASKDAAAGKLGYSSFVEGAGKGVAGMGMEAVFGKIQGKIPGGSGGTMANTMTKTLGKKVMGGTGYEIAENAAKKKVRAGIEKVLVKTYGLSSNAMDKVMKNPKLLTKYLDDTILTGKSIPAELLKYYPQNAAADTVYELGKETGKASIEAGQEVINKLKEAEELCRKRDMI